MQKIQIHHFSDILCVWAHVSQIRIDEMLAEFGDAIEVTYHLFPVFGDVPGKIEKNWSNRGGISGYSEHVRTVAADFPHASVSPRAWMDATPCSSLPAHQYLLAVRQAETDGHLPAGSFLSFKKGVRKAFFAECQDVARQDVLNSLLEKHDLAIPAVADLLASGEAMRLLACDIQLATELSIRSSPTLVFNEDRQRLSGNVGYKIIQANIRELLERPAAGQSWC